MDAIEQKIINDRLTEQTLDKLSELLNKEFVRGMRVHKDHEPFAHELLKSVVSDILTLTEKLNEANIEIEVLKNMINRMGDNKND